MPRAGPAQGGADPPRTDLEGTDIMKETLIFALGLTLLAAAGAEGQTLRNCAQREVVVTRLAETYGETRQSIGLGANNAVMEVFASTETGTWTITVTLPNGLTCLLASGRAFETLSEDLPAAGSDA